MFVQNHIRMILRQLQQMILPMTLIRYHSAALLFGPRLVILASGYFTKYNKIEILDSDTHNSGQFLLSRKCHYADILRIVLRISFFSYKTIPWTQNFSGTKILAIYRNSGNCCRHSAFMGIYSFIQSTFNDK